MIKSIVSLLCYPYRAYKLHYAIAKADNLHRKYKERFYVMEAVGNRLMIVNRTQFRILKRKSIISPNASIFDALRESFYFTPDRGENTPMNENIKKQKKRMYFDSFK